VCGKRGHREQQANDEGQQALMAAVLAMSWSHREPPLAVTQV
jgi:hypothetical protein